MIIVEIKLKAGTNNEVSLSELEYNGLGQLKRILTPEGYLSPNGTQFHTYTVSQKTDYYAFGLPTYNSLNPEAQPYKRESKEYDEMHGWNMYDQGARHFGAALPVTLTIDPLAEKYYNISPYAQWGNNPVRYVDPNGMDWYSYQEEYEDENGEIQTRTAYKYVKGTMSQEEMESGGYTHLGKTFLSGDTYYSLGGAELKYDINNIGSVEMLTQVMNTDKTIIATINAMNKTGDFWNNYSSMVSSGGDVAKIISTYMDSSSGLKGILGNVGIVFAAINGYNDYQSFREGELKVDAVANIISLAGVPGAGLSLTYTIVGKPAAKGIRRFEEYLQRYFRNIWTNPMNYTGWPF